MRGGRGSHPRSRDVRARLGLIVVGVVTVAAVTLSLLAYGLVSRSLRSEMLDRAVEDARFSVRVLAEERLGARVGPGDIESSGLADDLRRRGLDVYVDLGGGENYLSGLQVPNAPELVSADVRALMAAGNVAAQWVTADEVSHLVVGARKAPEGPDFYFVTDVGELENALVQLRLLLSGAALAVILVGGVAGWRAARLAGTLADSVAELREAQRRERRFVADVSHELRTPVTALVNEAAELRGQVGNLPEGTHRVVELLDGDVRRLRDLVEELLELSRLDAAGDAAEVELAELDVAAFLDAIVARRLPTATVHAPTPLRVRTDRRRLERIVGNLVDNARLHAGDGEVDVRAALEGSALVITVTDRGPGVPEDQLERIFDRFAKGDAARAGGGSGLGLAIVQEHARALGARVVARNREDGGLEVELRLDVTVVTEP